MAGWRRLLLMVAVVNVVVGVVIQVALADSLIPPLAAFMLLYLIGIAVLRKPGRPDRSWWAWSRCCSC